MTSAQNTVTVTAEWIMADGTITVTVEKIDAVRLIGLAGGEPNPRGGWDIFGVHYWQTDEALTVALENISDANGVALSDKWSS